MKRLLTPRAAVPLALALITTLLAVGCTVRPDISESLDLAGNHSAGDLVMVTSDTSKDGYQYLEPNMSPDHERIVFSVDWPALPPPGHLPDQPPLIRQIGIIPVGEHRRPLEQLSDAGAQLVRFRPVPFEVAGSEVLMFPEDNLQKGGPVWADADHVLFWMQTPRGARIFRVMIPSTYTVEDLLPAEVIYREPDDDRPDGRNWEHYSPALSPDGHWLAFSRFGYYDLEDPETVTPQQIWVCAMPEEGEVSTLAFPVTETAATCDGPTWSPDGRRLAFSATPDLVGEHEYYAQEIFTIAFDTTGVAAEGHPVLNNDLQRLTYSQPDEGSNVKIRNTDPAWSADGGIIAFVSDRRAPTITLRERNIWYVPARGIVDPRILFFSRADDVDPSFTGRPGRELILSSALGFPSEVLDEIWRETADSLQAAHPDWPLPLVEQGANAVRSQLETYQDVMSHIYLFSNWE